MSLSPMRNVIWWLIIYRLLILMIINYIILNVFIINLSFNNWIFLLLDNLSILYFFHFIIIFLYGEQHSQREIKLIFIWFIRRIHFYIFLSYYYNLSNVIIFLSEIIIYLLLINPNESVKYFNIYIDIIYIFIIIIIDYISI